MPRDREKPLRCNACGGALILMTDIPEYHLPEQEADVRVRYFSCERCAHIQIVEE